MNIDELRTVQTKERQKDSLQHLRDSFYEDVADYIQGLKSEREAAAERADDPFSSPEVSRLTDEIETAEDVVEAIYERRVGKVVKLASFAAAEMPVDEEGLTTQERDLFEDLVARIEDNKGRVLDILAGEGDAGATSSPATGERTPTPDTESSPSPTDEPPEPAPPADESVLADAMGAADGAASTSEPAPDATDDAEDEGPTHREVPPDEPPEVAGGPPESESTPDESTPAEPSPEEQLPDETPTTIGGDGGSAPEGDSADDDGEERTTVRITRDVGQILGVDDREYELADDDVVALPAANADALLQRDAAQRLE